MKKKLLIAAMGTMLAAGPMLAGHAAVTLGGKFHVSLDRQDSDTPGSVGAAIGGERSFLSNNSSRFFISADEDLGGGLKALAYVESTVGVDEGVGAISARNTYLGLSAGWGTLKFGRHDTPTKDVARAVDLFNERIGDSRVVVGTSIVLANIGIHDARPNNAIRYDSPSFGGARVGVLYSTAEESLSCVGAGPTCKRFSAGLSWTSGPLYVGAAIEEANFGTTDDARDIRAAVKYNFGGGDVHVLYDQMNNQLGVDGSDQAVLGVGASFKVGGNNTFKAQYYMADENDLAADTGGNILAIGFDHALSKNTLVYIAYARADSDTLAAIPVSSANGGHGDNMTLLGEKPTALSVGMEMKF